MKVSVSFTAISVVTLDAARVSVFTSPFSLVASTTDDLKVLHNYITTL